MNHVRLVAIPLLLGLSMSAHAGTQLGPDIDAFSLSDDQGPDLGVAAKVKLNRTDSGMLVSVFGDGAGPDVYDVKGDKERPARDIFVRTCDSATMDCTDDSSWSAPLNLSGTANLSSMSTEWQGAGTGLQPYYGDSEKPNIFKNGTNVAVSWVDHYCEGGEQRSVTYLERDNREVAFACAYIATSADEGRTWNVAQQLSDGYRDAKQDVHRGSSQAWVMTWQEDPQGLQIGEADGPGDGASGANTNNGTDIWFSSASIPDFQAGSFSAPVRLTNNFTHESTKQGSTTEIEDGKAGAARANLAIMGPTVLMAYEETKGSGGVDEGKFIRYHAFAWNSPPTSCEDDGTGACATNARGEAVPAEMDPARAGCILSDPNENSRRSPLYEDHVEGRPQPRS